LEYIGNQQIEDFPSTTLFFNDLAEIIEIFCSACKKVEIDCGKYRITDASELEELAKKFPNGRFESIHIQGLNPYISLDLKNYKIEAYISENTIEQHGIIAQARNIILRGKKIKLDWIWNVFMGSILVIGMWLLKLKLNTQMNIIGITLILEALLSVPTGVNYAMKNNVIVYTEIRSIKKGFIERNKDSLLVNIIVAIFAAALAVFIPKYLQ
jgi:hypothetical protein